MVLREPKAVKELESLNLELTRASTELASLQAALAESGRRAEKAKAENAAKSEADRAKPILERLEQRGKAMDEAAALYKQHYVGAEQDLDELRRIGIGAPGRALAISNFRHCYDSAMQGLDVKTAVIPPQRRRGWEGGVRWTSAAARLFLRACTHRRSMSAFGGKADIQLKPLPCPLMTRSGHRPPEIYCDSRRSRATGGQPFRFVRRTKKCFSLAKATPMDGPCIKRSVK